MGHPRTNRLPIAVALLASALLHLGAAALLVASPAAGTRFDQGHASAEELAVTPGIAASQAVTVSWIGFTEPTPHSAPEADSDQAQVSPDAGESAREMTQAAHASVEQARQAAEQAAQDVRERVAPMLERGAVLAEALHDQAVVAVRRQEAEEAAARAAQARAAREAAEGGRNALPDEREAAATSTQSEMVYQAGQPLAREGLEIVTVRPVFDAATRVLDLRAARRQPVVAISFARDGSVRSVTFANGGTGIRSIDEPIKTAVFRWTARGSDLAALPADDPEAAVIVRIRFSL